MPVGATGKHKTTGEWVYPSEIPLSERARRNVAFDKWNKGEVLTGLERPTTTLASQVSRALESDATAVVDADTAVVARDATGAVAADTAVADDTAVVADTAAIVPVGSKEATEPTIIDQAFPEDPKDNVDIDEVFPSVIKQFGVANQKDKDIIRKEMWVESPKAKTRAGQVLSKTVRSMTYPVKEIYYNLLEPFGLLGEAAVEELVQEVGGLWKASTEAINNNDVSFMHRTNQIHTVLELEAERPNFKKEISAASEKLLLINPKMKTDRLKQGIANLVFGDRKQTTDPDSPEVTSLLAQNQ